MSEEQARGIRLTDKQIVFSVMAATVVAVVVFLCGVFVGRGVSALRPASAEASSVDGLVSPDPSMPMGETDDGAGMTPGANGAIATPPERLRYPELLGKNAPPAEVLPGAPPPDPAADGPDGPSAEVSSPAGRPATAAVTPVDTKPVASAPAPAAPTLPASADEGTGPFTVQVSAVRRKSEAQGIVDRLKKKGFPAYVFTPPQGDPRGGFRVRVGTFKSRPEAAAMASRLQKEKYQPWITR